MPAGTFEPGFAVAVSVSSEPGVNLKRRSHLSAQFQSLGATWQIIALIVTPPLHAPGMAVGSQAPIYWLRYERITPDSPSNFLWRNPG